MIAERESEAYIENSVWECLTCGVCRERCPSGRGFQSVHHGNAHAAGWDERPEGLSRPRRGHAFLDEDDDCPGPEAEPARLAGAGLKVASSGAVAFFTGCAPYFNVFFAGIDVNTLSIVRDSIRLLNFLDIKPVVFEDERCCGHDLLWSGDSENFEALCRLNYKAFQAAGVEEIIVSCPECFQVLSEHMPEVIPGMKLKVTLLLDLLHREISKGGVTFRPLKRRATYQDPCRLGRMADRARPAGADSA